MNENLIYHFEVRGDDGNPLMRAVDPYRVDRLLAHSLGGEKLSNLWKTAQGPPSPLSLEAQERLLEAAKSAFDLKAVDEHGVGLTEPAIIRVLKEFIRWKSEVKKNTVTSATSFTSPTDGTPPGHLPISNCTPCGSDGGDTPINGHMLSPSHLP